jgi:two-component SAPR family response regulator
MALHASGLALDETRSRPPRTRGASVELCAPGPDVSSPAAPCVDAAARQPAAEVARAYVQRARDEHQVRSETIRGLLHALDEQQARVGLQLDMALRLFDDGFEAGRGATAAAQRPADVPADQRSGTVVRCFGSLEVSVGGVAVEAWRSGKARALFEYLVTHRDRATPRDSLIQALWPDPDALAAGTSLKVAVHALRQMLGELGSPQQRPLAVLMRESTYQLVAPDLWVDVDEFERCYAVAGALEARGQTPEALALYQRAADLYRGDFLAETWDDWAVFRREGLKDQYLLVLARLADAALQAGEHHRCIRLCRQLLEHDCCREDPFRILMLCHARLGQPGRVRRWYELCARTMRSMLDTDPEPETERVYRWATSGQARPRALSSALRPAD